MGNYSTSCSGKSILNGSMVAASGNVSSYSSNSDGAGTVNNTGNSSTNLSFTVSFPNSSNPNRQYPITASPTSNGYSGSADSNGIEAGEDPWTATEIPMPDDDESRDDGDGEYGGDDEGGD